MKQWTQSVLGCMTAGLLMMTSFPVFAADSSSDPSGKSQPVTEGSTFDDGTLTYTILKNMYTKAVSFFPVSARGSSSSVL